MTTVLGPPGRLGNQIIRMLSTSLIAEKFNLQVNYPSSKDFINKLGIILFNGINVYNTTKSLTDSNYFTIYNSDNLDYNLNPNNDYFQTKEITNLLYNYLNTDNIKSNIIKQNKYNNRYNSNNDLFIHIRLTDVAHFNPGIYYYINTIKSIKFDNLYISTDDKNHSLIKSLIKIYPDTNLFISDEISTIQFGSTCKHIILSHGSFSALIGYLSFFSDVYYPEYEENKIWYGDMFSINNWKKSNVTHS
jgi:hypothetical protein